jgi:hypothetical protein
MSDLITLPRATVQQALEALVILLHTPTARKQAWDAVNAVVKALEQEPVKRAQHAPEEPRSKSSNPPAVYKDEGIEAWYYAKPR